MGGVSGRGQHVGKLLSAAGDAFAMKARIHIEQLQELPSDVPSAAIPDGGYSPGVTIVSVDDAAQLDAFIDLPARLYGQDSSWIQPLRAERRHLLNTAANRFFRNAEVRLWLALRGNRPVGRISAQIDRRVHLHVEPALGQWGMFDAEDDPEVAEGLLNTAEDWLRSKGMHRALGPCNLSLNDEPGLLVEGFEAPTTFLTTYSPPYLAALIERSGYAKARDRLSFVLDIAAPFPQTVQRFLNFGADAPFNIRTIDLRRLPQELKLLEGLLADVFSDNWGYMPANFQLGFTGRLLLRILFRRHWIRIAEVDGAPVGVIMVLPNLNEMIGDMRGSLLPFNWIRLIARILRPRTDWVRVPIFGLHPEFRKRRLGISIIYSLCELARREAGAQGVKAADLCWVQEGNDVMIRLISAMGAWQHKRFRLFHKDLRIMNEAERAAC